MSQCRHMLSSYTQLLLFCRSILLLLFAWFIFIWLWQNKFIRSGLLVGPVESVVSIFIPFQFIELWRLCSLAFDFQQRWNSHRFMTRNHMSSYDGSHDNQRETIINMKKNKTVFLLFFEKSFVNNTYNVALLI